MALSETRFGFPPLGIDVFDPPLHGLVLTEADFTTDEEASSFLPPRRIIARVTDDARFTGGRLIRTQRHELLGWLTEYGITPESTALDPDDACPGQSY
ncbi:hypothetical protein ACIGXM_25820 [Kitasatospora sp. NPDC052896]|uniref:hypothetical protein n=1 Tax=Kitasatospora sp. NPDC052896 TaxID=3364061 RepID=UPI0037CBED08